MDWVLYFRKSGPGDKSIEDQERVGRRDIASIGGRVVATFSDNLSASRYRRVQDRPGFQKARAAIESGGARGLWTFAANRAHRDLDDYVPLRRLCIETGTLWRYGGRTYDLSKTSDRRTANADALRAEEYSDDLADAINRGVSLALEDGKPHGRLPRGYKIIRDEFTGKAINRVPVPAQAAVLQWAADQVLTHGVDITPLAVAFAPRWKAAGGRPFTNGVVDPKILREMLISPTYAGLRTHKGQVHRAGTWKAIFDLDTHQRLVQVLTDPARTKHRGTVPRYLCTYIAECSECGAGVSARTPTAHGRTYPTVYRCAKGHLSRSMKRVDEHVEELLMQMLEQTEVSAMLAETEEGAGTIDKELALIEELRRESAEYVKEAARTRMRAELVAIYVDGLEDQIREAEERISAITGAYTSDLLIELAKDPRRKWKEYDLLQRREVLRQTVRIVIRPAPRGGLGPGKEGPLNVDVLPAGALRRGEPGVSSRGRSWPSWHAEQASQRDAD